MLQRPKTTYIGADKDAGRNWQLYSGPYNEFDAYFHVTFYRGKMYQVSSSILASEDQVMEKINTVKQGLSKRYGPPISEKGKYLDLVTKWDLGGGYEASISIRKSTVSTQPPFIVTIIYYHSETGDIVNKALSAATDKDY